MHLYKQAPLNKASSQFILAREQERVVREVLGGLFRELREVMELLLRVQQGYALLSSWRDDLLIQKTNRFHSADS